MLKAPPSSAQVSGCSATHRKFYLFNVGVFRAVRPRGPLDAVEEIEGPAIESLVFQEVRAINDNLGLEYGLHYWRTTDGEEVDIVLYGARGIRAIEVKRSNRVRADDLRGLRAFLDDYPMARAWLVYTGTRRYHEGAIEIVPLPAFLTELGDLL